MLTLNSTFIDNNSMALRAAAEPLNVEMPHHQQATSNNQKDNSQQRNSKLIYLNPSDFIPKSSDSPVYGTTSLMNNYNIPMSTSVKGHLSTASSSPNHYSNSSTSSGTSTSDDTDSNSSDCPISSSNSGSDPSSSTYAIPPDTQDNESPYRVETTVLNGSIYQTLTRRGEINPNHRSSIHRPNYLECIEKLIEDEPLQSSVGFNQRNNQSHQPIYSNKMDLLTRNRYKNYEDHSQLVASDFHRSNKNSVSFRVKPDSNQRILSDLMRPSKAGTFSRPVPPSRTSSLQYRNRTMHPSASLFIYNKKNTAANAINSSSQCHSNSSSDGDESSAIMEINPVNCPDESIYSAFSLRMSRLSSFNLGAQEPKEGPDQPDLLLNKGEQFRIESFYKSIGSSVYASKCAADLYTTDLQCLIKLLDWQHQFNGVPVWVFNTGLNPKRPKGLSLVIADKGTGFASIRLNQISHINDLKWTKPGHLTLKIYPKNLGDHTFNSSTDSTKNLSRKQLAKQSRLKQSTTSDELMRLQNCHSTLNQSFNTYSDLMTKLELNKGESNREDKFVFAALRFGSDFECSKFYDFYRNLFVDSQNDDLFNPLYSKQQQPQGKLNMMKVFLKKITKSSISSPVAFQHVNSLSMANDIRE